MLKREEKKRKKSKLFLKEKREKKRLEDMTKRVVRQINTMFPKKKLSPDDFEREMKKWLEKEEKKRRARRTPKKRGGRRKRMRGGGPLSPAATNFIYYFRKGGREIPYKLSLVFFDRKNESLEQKYVDIVE